MKIIFDHSFGRMTDMDVSYSVAKAEVGHQEWKHAPTLGWLPDEWEPPFWFTGRQTRLDLVAFKKKHKFPKNLRFSLVEIGKIADSRLANIWRDYTADRFESDHLEFRKTLEYQPEHKRILVVYDETKLVAFSILRVWPMFVSLQLAWNYHNPKLSVGVHAQYYEMEIARSMGYRYVYLCPGYETACIWKSRFPGFEWWTGEKWSTNKKRYVSLCERDSKIRLIDELDKITTEV